MADGNPPLETIEQILESARTIAVVGASSKPARPSYGVFRVLLDAGYQVLPINPNETEVHGQPALPSLEAVSEPVDLVDVFRRPELTPAVAASAVAIRARTLWLQQGVINEEARRIAREGGLEVVMDLCIAVALARLGRLTRRPG